MTEVVADLHLHSKYSRAVSQQMIIPEMARWAKIKGIDLLGTGDFTHSVWVKELQANLEEENGVLRLKSGENGVKFLLTTEISSIYSQGGKTRKIHNIIMAPSFSVVEKINQELRNRGANLMSDGRPIIGLTCPQLCELVFSVSKDCLIIPAHCLLPHEGIHVSDGIKKIDQLKEGEKVFTHQNRLKRVKKVFFRSFVGKVYKIIPDYFRLGTTVTGEHPFWAIKTKKNCPSVNRSFGVCKPLCSQIKRGCTRRYFGEYKPKWIQAQALEKGDILVFPRFTKTKDKDFLRLSEVCKIVNLEKKMVSLPGTRTLKLLNKIPVNESFCRLVGYFLAEGYLGKDDVSFCFHSKEQGTIKDLQQIMNQLFGITKARIYRRKNYKSIEIMFFSKVLNLVFCNLFFTPGKKRGAAWKHLPSWMLTLPLYKQKEILKGWWRGDKGYTTSRILMNQMKQICLRLGIIPSIGVDLREKHEERGKHDKFEKRTIVANWDTYHLSNLSFFEDPYELLNEPMFAKFRTKMKRRRGWMDKDYAYLPIRKIEMRHYKGKVYNLEVEDDNSYTTEFACVHNCWTPWFSLFGSNSGFNSLEECFGDLSKYIYAIETGLSSDPGMNWRVKDLDEKTILSFSDAHSLQKLGREMTVLQTKNSKLKINYEDIVGAIKNDKSSNWEVGYTVEFYPEEGKYHYTGHRNCGIIQSPEETARKGTTCPVCGKGLTVGVMERVEKLSKSTTLLRQDFAGQAGATRTDEFGVRWFEKEGRAPYVTLVPLAEIIAESLGVGEASKKVEEEYLKLINIFGSELRVLMKLRMEEIAKVAGEKLAEGIGKVRKGDIFIRPGYDGEYGKVAVWSSSAEAPGNEGEKVEQGTLF